MPAHQNKKARLVVATGTCDQTAIIIVGDEEIADAKAANTQNRFLKLLCCNPHIFQAIMRFLTLAPTKPANAIVKTENWRERFGDPDAGLAFVHCCAVTLPMGRILTPEVYFGPSYRPRISGHADPTLLEVARAVVCGGVSNIQQLLYAVHEANFTSNLPTPVNQIVHDQRVVLTVLENHASSLWKFGSAMSVTCARSVLEILTQCAHRYNQVANYVQEISISAQLYEPEQNDLLQRVLSTFAKWFYYDDRLFQELFRNTAERIGALASSFPVFFTHICTHYWHKNATDAQIQAVYAVVPAVHRYDLAKRIAGKLQTCSVADLKKLEKLLENQDKSTGQ